jgi:hypothetical protein
MNSTGYRLFHLQAAFAFSVSTLHLFFIFICGYIADKALRNEM